MAEKTEEAVEEEAAEEVVEEEATEDKATETEETSAEDKAEATEDTKVLLSDDEDDGAGDVPDKYEFVSPKDIGPIEMTDDVQAQFDAFDKRAKDVGLTQVQYQTLVEGEIRRGREAIEVGAQAYQQRVKDWAEVTKSDKELGGESLAENLSVAKLGMDTFGTPELKKLFDAPSPENPDGLGLGNHPEIIRLLHRAGLNVKESDLVEGGNSAVEADASLRRMYPSMFKDEAAA